MSKTVDERVVEMRFDNSQFESNVKTTMSTLDRLKAALKFPSKTDALSSLANGAKNATSGINNVNGSVGTLRASFSALQVVGVTALANITNTAVNAGKRIVSALTIDPITSGLSEYELQMNSIQTILANTKSKGTTLDDVNAALSELNEYADKTIYNFAQMTHNIGTFTAAGVDLDTAVASIKGISNLAAMSGSSATQASTAMYQLSQAIAAGRISLMDWNSVVNAGMGGEQFQNALKRTAEHFGTNVDAMIEKYGSFRESLTQGGWLTTDVLTETLKQLSGAYSEADLIAQGYTQDQAKAIVEMAASAESAATDITTFTKLIETATESLGSGWAQTWQAIFGDFETAKAFWSDLWNNTLSPLIDGMSDARNALIGGAMDMGGSGGWDALSTKITEAGISLDTFQQTLSQVVSEQGGSLDGLIEKYGSLGAAMTSGEVSADSIIETLKRISEETKNTGASTEDLNAKLVYFQDVVDRVWAGEFKNAPERFQLLADAGYDYVAVQDLVNKTVDGHRLTLEDLSDAQLASIGYTQEEIDTIHALAEEAEKAGRPLNDLINSLSQKSGRDLFFQSIKNILSAILAPMQAFSRAWGDVFSVDSTDLYNAIAAFEKFTASIIISGDDLENLTRTLRGVFSVLHIVASFAGGGFRAAFSLISSILGLFGTNLLEVTAVLGDWATELDKALTSGDLFVTVLEGLKDVLNFILSPLRDFVSQFIDFPDVTSKLEPIKEFFSSIKEYLSGFENLSLGDSFTKIVTDVQNAFKNLTWDDVLSALSTLGTRIRETFSRVAEQAKEVGPDIIAGLQNGLKDGVDGLITAAQDIGNKIIEAVKALLGIHSPSTVFFEIGKNIIEGLVNGIEFMIGELVSIASYLVDQLSGVFSKVDWGMVLGVAGGVGAFIVLNKFVTALNTAATALKNISDPFLGLGQIFGGVAGIMKSFSKYLDEKKWTVRAHAVQTLAISLGILAAAVVVLANVPVDGLARATTVIVILAGALAGLVAAINVFAGQDAVDTAKISAVLLSIGVAFGLMAATMAILSGLSPEGAQQALDMMSMFGLIIAALMGMTQFTGKPEQLNNMASFFTSIGAALLLMSVSVKLIGGMDAGQLQQAVDAISMFGLVIAALMGMTQLMGKGKAVSNLSSMLKSVSVAFIAMTAVVKLIGGMDAASLGKGLLVITYFTGIIVGLMAATRLVGGSGLTNVGNTLLSVSGCFVFMAAACKIIATMSAEELNKGVAYITLFAGIITALMAVTKLMGGGEVAKVGATILAMSLSIAIIAGVAAILGKINTEDLAKGVIVVGVLSLIVDGMVMATKNAKDVKGTMVGIAVAIGVLAASIAVLSFIDTGKLISASAALTAVLVGLAAVTYAASQLKIDSKVVATFVTMGLLLGAVTGVIYLISGLDATNVLPNAVALGTLMVSLGASMKLMGSIGKISAGAVGTIAAVTAVMYALSGVVAILSTIDATSTIPNALALSTLLMALSASVAILGTMGKSSVGDISGSLVLLAGVTAATAILAAILVAINGLNPASSIGNVAALASLLLTMTLVTAALSKLGNIDLASAAKAAVALDAVTLIVGALVGVVGGLNQLTQGGLASAISSGADVLAALGDAIGSFIGGIAGGLAGGALDAVGPSIEKFGTSLSNFMTNLQPFIDGASNITPEIGSAISNLAMAILTLTAADILDGIASFLGGGTDWAEFGSKLATLGSGLTAFSLTTMMVDSERVGTAAEALRTVVTAMSQIPSEGGLLQGLLGGKNYDGFATGMESMGNALNAFNTATTAITPEAIQPKTEALSNIISTLAQIPDSGGLLQGLLGGKNYDGFSTGMTAIGDGLKNFYMSAAYISNPEILNTASDCLSTLITTLSGIPTEGGFLDNLFGDGNIDYNKFAGGLQSIGGALRDFNDSTKDIKDETHFRSIVNAAKTLITGLASINMDNGGGLFGQMMQVEGKTFTGFGTSLSSLGSALNSFASATLESDFSNIGSAVNAAKQILDFVNATAEINTDGVDSFKNAVNSLAEANVSKMLETFSSASGDLSGAGGGLIKAVADGIGQNASSVATAAKQAVADAASSLSEKYSDFNTVGNDLSSEMANGIDEKADEVSTAAENAVNDAATAASNAAGSKFVTVGNNIAEGLRSGIKARAGDVATEAAQMVTDALDAARAAADSHSPSRKFYQLGVYCGMGLTNALDYYRKYAYSSGTNLMRSAIDGVSGLSTKVGDYLASSLESEATPTIRPVMDLSNVRNGVDYINSAFSLTSSTGLFNQANRINRALNSNRQNGTTDDVIRELSRLRSDIQQMPVNQYTVEGITYDDGSAIAGAVGQLIRTTRLERRI